MVSGDGMCVPRRGCPLQPENAGKRGFLFQGRWFAFSSPLLRLHCDTNLNQSVPKKKEKYPTLLLQPFQTSCPGSDFAKSVVPGSAGQFVFLAPTRGEASGLHIQRVLLERSTCALGDPHVCAWGPARVCSGTRTCVLGDPHVCSGTHTCSLGDPHVLTRGPRNVCSHLLPRLPCLALHRWSASAPGTLPGQLKIPKDSEEVAAGGKSVFVAPCALMPTGSPTSDPHPLQGTQAEGNCSRVLGFVKLSLAVRGAAPGARARVRDCSALGRAVEPDPPALGEPAQLGFWYNSPGCAPRDGAVSPC